MYVYITYTIFHFGSDKVAPEGRTYPFKAYTNFNECKKALQNRLADYLTKSYFSMQEIQSGNYNRKEMLEMKTKDMVLGYAVYDLINTYNGKHDVTRFLINRYKLE